MNGWGIDDADWEAFADWLVDSTDERMHRSQGVGGIRAGIRHQRGLVLDHGGQDWLVRGATAHATQLALLDRIHGLTHRDVLVVKGPEVATCYPEPAWRTSSDLDLFAPDAEGLWRDLVSGGFEPTEASGRHDRHHHLVPLHLPGFRLGVEVHRALGWPRGAREPAASELAASASPSIADPRFGAMSAELAFAHQLQHAWHGVPFGTLRDLVDLAALWTRTDPGRLAAVLAGCRLTRLHRSTQRFARGVIAGRADVAPASSRLVAGPSLQRRSEEMHRVLPRRVVGLVGAAGIGFAVRSVAHDAARVAARRG